MDNADWISLGPRIPLSQWPSAAAEPFEGHDWAEVGEFLGVGPPADVWLRGSPQELEYLQETLGVLGKLQREYRSLNTVAEDTNNILACINQLRKFVQVLERRSQTSDPELTPMWSTLAKVGDDGRFLEFFIANLGLMRA